jgi:hypothetical protein
MVDIVAPMAGSAHSSAKECFRQRIRYGRRPGDADASTSDGPSEFGGALEVVSRSKDHQFIEHGCCFNRIIASGGPTIGEQQCDATRR